MKVLVLLPTCLLHQLCDNGPCRTQNHGPALMADNANPSITHHGVQATRCQFMGRCARVGFSIGSRASRFFNRITRNLAFGTNACMCLMQFARHVYVGVLASRPSKCPALRVRVWKLRLLAFQNLEQFQVLMPMHCCVMPCRCIDEQQ